jgi:hypothetical protein
MKIGRAIYAEQNKQGSTLQYIKKYLEANYNIKPTDKRIKKTINKLLSLTSGERLIMNKHHTGHYRLSPEFKRKIEQMRSNK